jgi:dihydroorotate dehydrogenase
MMALGKAARPVVARDRTASMRDAEVPIVCPVEAMGLRFGNPLGLAAGFDRTGRLIASLAPLGFGHIEVGTITPGTANLALPASPRAHLRIGASIGSARRGIDWRVVADYVAALRRVWSRADYVVANLSSPFLARQLDTPGVEALIEALGEARRSLGDETGCRRPLLVKVTCGPPDTPLPAALKSVRRHRLSGAVLVSSSLRQIAAAREHLDGAALISVGGATSAADVRARLAAGAALVQIYTTFVRDGPDVVRRILADLVPE